MAIKINNCTVIDDSRNAINLGSICATTIYGDGSNLTGVSAAGGANTISAANCVCICSTYEKVLSISFTEGNLISGSAYLPDATCLNEGTVYTLHNSNPYTKVGVYNAAGGGIGTINPGEAVDVHLYDNSTLAGCYTLSGGNFNAAITQTAAGANIVCGFCNTSAKDLNGVVHYLSVGYNYLDSCCYATTWTSKGGTPCVIDLTTLVSPYTPTVTFCTEYPGSIKFIDCGIAFNVSTGCRIYCVVSINCDSTCYTAVSDCHELCSVDAGHTVCSNTDYRCQPNQAGDLFPRVGMINVFLVGTVSAACSQCCSNIYYVAHVTKNKTTGAPTICSSVCRVQYEFCTATLCDGITYFSGETTRGHALGGFFNDRYQGPYVAGTMGEYQYNCKYRNTTYDWYNIFNYYGCTPQCGSGNWYFNNIKLCCDGTITVYKQRMDCTGQFNDALGYLSICPCCTTADVETYYHSLTNLCFENNLYIGLYGRCCGGGTTNCTLCLQYYVLGLDAANTQPMVRGMTGYCWCCNQRAQVAYCPGLVAKLNDWAAVGLVTTYTCCACCCQFIYEQPVFIQIAADGSGASVVCSGTMYCPSEFQCNCLNDPTPFGPELCCSVFRNYRQYRQSTLPSYDSNLGYSFISKSDQVPSATFGSPFVKWACTDTRLGFTMLGDVKYCTSTCTIKICLCRYDWCCTGTFTPLTGKRLTLCRVCSHTCFGVINYASNFVWLDGTCECVCLYTNAFKLRYNLTCADDSQTGLDYTGLDFGGVSHLNGYFKDTNSNTLLTSDVNCNVLCLNQSIKVYSIECYENAGTVFRTPSYPLTGDFLAYTSTFKYDSNTCTYFQCITPGTNTCGSCGGSAVDTILVGVGHYDPSTCTVLSPKAISFSPQSKLACIVNVTTSNTSANVVALAYNCTPFYTSSCLVTIEGRTC